MCHIHARVLGVVILVNQISPLECSKQKVLYLTAVKQNDIVEPYSNPGITNTHGLLFVPADIKFSVVCCIAKQQKLLSPSVFKTSPFIVEGFGSWKKALERFDMHEKSEMHREAVERLACKASHVHIGNMINAQSLFEQEFHRSMLFKLMRAVKYLGKQGLPLRGHNASSEACQ